MTGIRDLPRAAWVSVIRGTALIIGLSALFSALVSEGLMLVLSQGMDLAGLATSIAMPVILGTPPLAFTLVRQQQLKLANAQLVHLAATDWLTGCRNRRAFTQQVSADLDAGKGGVLLVIDADRFKAINDLFGHDQGDEALVAIAGAIRSAIRPADLQGRLGGEEFSVFLPGADQLTAEIIAERVRHAVEALDFTPGGEPHPLSVSIGAAAATNRQSFSDLFRLADQALYAAKHAGRNCIRFTGIPAMAKASAA